MLLMLSIACNQVSSRYEKADSVSAPQQEPPHRNNVNEQTKDTIAAIPPTPSNPDCDKKIVKTANMQVEVKSYKHFNETLHRRIREAGGYIAQEDENASTYKIENNLVVKIPVDRFDETLMQLASDSDKVQSKKITTEDVTTQVIDTRARMETKKEVRQRYMDILHHSQKTAEVLAAQQQVDEMTAQVEGAASRIAYLNHASAYSTIHLNYYQILDNSIKEDQTPGFIHQIGHALGEGWGACSAFLVGVITLWPLWLLSGLAWMGVRKYRKQFRKFTS